MVNKALEMVRGYVLQERIERNRKRIHLSGPGQKTSNVSYESIIALGRIRSLHVAIYRRMRTAMMHIDEQQRSKCNLHELLNSYL